ncbi:MAG: ornithine carbamoyltransferase [Planctomycetes bacterium]|nr:ornithine carbamoyltransferase [Planctomycetota bacterium]
MSDIRHFVNILDHSTEELEHILARASELKSRMKCGIQDRLMMGKTLAMFFEKPSMRTRVSLEVAASSMGGSAICLDTNEGPGARLGDRESIDDVARVISRYVDVISIRTFEHSKVEALAKFGSVPVINALSDYSHPTQAMADIMTMREHLGNTRGKTLVFIGDGNNVARSLASLCGKLGVRFVLGCPEGYGLDPEFVTSLKKICPDADFSEINDPVKAVKDAAVVYTDVWASMGQETERAKRLEIFKSYQVNSELMSKAPAGAKVLHCLPAHRGEEITAEVMESEASLVFDEAENRMHINRALFAVLVADPK